MRRLIVVGAAVILTITAASGALALWPIGEPVSLSERKGDAERGAYLSRAGGCIACHSDRASGRPALTGGAPIETRFGRFIPPNLTQHDEAGIGAWSIEDFARAIRQGVSPDGQPYYPAFPYPFYADLSDQDIADIWAAFQTVAPQDVHPGDNEIAFPFNQRFGLKAWRAGFAQGPSTTAEEERSDAWNRGKWLVNGLAHCGACHTDRNFLGGRDKETALAGSDDLPEDGKAPAITTAALKTAGWTPTDLAFALRSGVKPDGDTFGGGMGEVVRDGTAWLRENDQRAIALYLLDQDTDNSEEPKE